MPNILDKIIAHKKLEINQQKAHLKLDEFNGSITPGDGSFLRAMQKPGLKIIAEIKPKSPSAGTLCQDLRLDEIVPIYNKYACAISVLTDKKYFGGGLELLSQVKEQSDLPLLCKDFILDPYQCYLARKHGAQAVLLIVKILAPENLNELYQRINNLGMTAVVEIQNKQELERAMALQPVPAVILINNRNLKDFQISFDTTKTLSQLITKQTIVISASGVQSKSHIDELLSFCSTFLIGSHFMRSANLDTELQALTQRNLSLSSGNVQRGGKQ